MTRKIFVAAGALAGSLGLLAIAAQAASLNVKTGLWETTMQNQVAGNMPIPQSEIAKMPAQARARMQAAMQAAMTAMNKARTIRSCVTQAQIDKAFTNPDRGGEHCDRVAITSSPTEQTFKMTCKGKHEAMTGSFHLVAASPTAITGTMDMAASGGSNTMKMHMVMHGRWLGTDCGSIKPGHVDVN